MRLKFLSIGVFKFLKIYVKRITISIFFCYHRARSPGCFYPSLSPFTRYLTTIFIEQHAQTTYKKKKKKKMRERERGKKNKNKIERRKKKRSSFTSLESKQFKFIASVSLNRERTHAHGHTHTHTRTRVLYSYTTIRTALELLERVEFFQ